MENPSLHKEPRKFYPIDFKLTLVEMATQPKACVAKIACEHGINDNLIFKWIRLWQKEGRVVYSTDRQGKHPQQHLRHYHGVLQADAFAGCDRLLVQNEKGVP